MHPYYALSLLFAINTLNYLDRQVLYALLPLIQEDLNLSDIQSGALASAFMLVYMCAAPTIAWGADRTRRIPWIAGGIWTWSLATVFSGLSRSYGQLLMARAAVGIGESSYGSISPSFVAEHFPIEKRGRVLAVFFMAIPLGSALGYLLGGMTGQLWGWRSAFFLAGLPGFFLGSLVWFLADPRSFNRTPNPDPQTPNFKLYLSLLQNKTFLLNTLSMAAMTFALGGLAVWMPTYLHRIWGMDVSKAGILLGTLTVTSGILGSLAGGWLGDWALRYTSKAYFLVSGSGLCMSLFFGYLTLASTQIMIVLGALFLAEFLCFLNMGPLNAIIPRVTPLSLRTMAFALNIFLIHALGDAISPTLIGYASEILDLRRALLGAVTFLGLAGGFCFWGMRHYDADTSRSMGSAI